MLIKQLLMQKQESRFDLESMIKSTDQYACKFLDHCEKLWEAEQLISGYITLLKDAIDNNKKTFESHFMLNR